MTSKPSTTNCPKLLFLWWNTLKAALFACFLKKKTKVRVTRTMSKRCMFKRYISGGYSDGVPPLPIPNREVKPDRADGTAHPRESRSPPFYNKPRDSKETRGFVAFGRW